MFHTVDVPALTADQTQLVTLGVLALGAIALGMVGVAAGGLGITGLRAVYKSVTTAIASRGKNI